MRALLFPLLVACAPSAPQPAPEPPSEPEPLPRRAIASVTASSSLDGERESFPAAHAVDGDDQTAWCEGADGLGLGETLTIALRERTELSKIAIDGGFFRDDRTLRNNGRPRMIRVESDEGWAHDVRFGRVPERKHKADKVRVRPMPLEQPGAAKVLTFTLVEADAGQFTEDVCISRIALYGS